MSKDQVGKTFSITTGKYDVTISTGPSYQSKRQEDRAMLQAMLTSPMGQLIANRAGDLVAKTLDSPIATELAERLMPLDIAQKAQAGNHPQIPPQLQQAMQKMQMENQQLTEALHKAMDEIDQNITKANQDMEKAKLDAETKIHIAQMDNEAKILIAEAQIAGNGALPALQQEFSDLKAQQEELAQLALAHHDMITQSMPPTPMPDGSAPMGAANPSTPQTAPVGPVAGDQASAQPVAPAGPSAGME
jgi:hypothetical protein